MTLYEGNTQEKEQQFKLLLESATTNDGWIEYDLPFPKKEFLQYVASEGYLLHGSSNNEIQEFEPRQANDSDKEFGNQKAVYAVNDEVLPLFYAIQDREKLKGRVRSGYSTNEETGAKSYEFRIEKAAFEKSPWKNGVVYIFSPQDFTEGTNSEGEPIGEYASTTAVNSIAKLKVTPEDFTYLDQVRMFEE